MHWTAAIANTLWAASSLPAFAGFQRVLREPGAVQRKKLQAYLQTNVDTAFGREHDFSSIRTYQDFARRVPMRDYAELEPWTARIQSGEQDVLTKALVTHLVPTSGSTSARKLIPFTADLQREFAVAVESWMVDLARQQPGILGGPAYWSISPALKQTRNEPSAIPIGFESDTAYLGGKRRRLVESVMAVRPQVQCADSMEVFRHTTLLHLLRCRELRFISVWHPSFLILLLDSLPLHWEPLLKELPDLELELRAIGPHDLEALWPKLRIISCWGDGAAAMALPDLQRRFPRVRIQPKGLLATEGVITFPFANQYPLAVTSHFFEFMDEAGSVCLADELRHGNEYEVVLTTGGGLWRYRLGDRVRVSGWLGHTPSLKFIGRIGGISDQCGEKLVESFVADVLQELLAESPPRFSLLAPDSSACRLCYVLFLEGPATLGLAAALDGALRLNPHYAYSRNLGQLDPPRIFKIAYRGFESYCARLAAGGLRLGEIKPTALSPLLDWPTHFLGTFLDESRDLAASNRTW